MTVAEIQIAILNGTFSERELRDINGTIVNILKADRKKKVNEAKQNLRVGMEVRFQPARISKEFIRSETLLFLSSYSNLIPPNR